jgi:hypothetical protein
MKVIYYILNTTRFFLIFLLVSSFVFFIYAYYDTTHLHPDIKGVNDKDVEYFLKFYSVLFLLWLTVHLSFNFLKRKINKG